MNSQKVSAIKDLSNSIVICTSPDQIGVINSKRQFKPKVLELDSSDYSSDSNNQGRWTDIEHLIFMAWIIEFGRDWKKIEFYVQTRSSSQARSHAQKVLRKLDRPAMIREILKQKEKLNFNPEEYKCEGLSVFSKYENFPFDKFRSGMKRKARCIEEKSFLNIYEFQSK